MVVTAVHFISRWKNGISWTRKCRSCASVWWFSADEDVFVGICAVSLVPLIFVFEEIFNQPCAADIKCCRLDWMWFRLHFSSNFRSAICFGILKRYKIFFELHCSGQNILSVEYEKEGCYSEKMFWSYVV